MIKLLPTKKSQFSSSKREAGFTLIELLIVIAIIVIIVALAAVSFATAQRTSRDSLRKSDMKKVQSALQRFYSDHGAYPDEKGDSIPLPGVPPSDYFTCNTAGDGTGTPIHGDRAFTCGANTYMTLIPIDQSTGRGYLYETHENIGLDALHRPGWCDNPTNSDGPTDTPPVYHGNCKHYTLWGKLENPSDPQIFKRLGSTDELCNIAYDIEDWIRPSHYGLNYCVHD